MEVYVKESLHVLNYKDEIQDSIFLSDDHMTPGYAYEISITEANTGYSDLSFSIPNSIVNNEGEVVKNPKLALLTPLVKLRYHRQVFYTGEKEISVREPVGYGDEVIYEDKTYSNQYPNNIIEDYIMDYIVQPVDKKRNSLEVSTKFTAIDYPRFNLSKKKVGLTIATDTLTKDEWSLYTNEPMNVPGTIKYVKWSAAMNTVLGDTTIPLEWNPETATQFPLNKEQVYNFVQKFEEGTASTNWPYGLLATAYYWPIKGTARFEGQMFTENSYLVLHLYDFYSLSTEGLDPDRKVGRYGFDWTQLYEVDKYLCPNNAANYLYHILDGTNWSVKLREDGKPDVDLEQVEISVPGNQASGIEKTTNTCNISVSNSNCYNAITAVCQGLQLYPVFDCINREVSLRLFAGKNYGLTYHLGSNLNSDSVKNDGEKVITKLYVTGGKDYNGDANINIGTAVRSFVQTGNPDDVEEPLWDPNDPRYIIKRSPYGTNYILNFKWLYDNKWIDKTDIIKIYKLTQQINDENIKFIDPYTEDRTKTLQEYNDAINEYDLAQGEYQAVLNSMMNKYYREYGKYSSGTVYAFHKAPLGVHKKDGKNYLWIKHCYSCGTSVSMEGSAKPEATCECGSTDVQVDEIYIPVYADYKDVIKEPEKPEYPYGTNYKDVAYEPHIRGDYLKLVTTLDRYSDDTPTDYKTDTYDIAFYEGKIYITRAIQPDNKETFDGYDYIIDGVSVRASSSNIEEWNEDIIGDESFVYHYGKMLDNLRKVHLCEQKIEELEQRYADWKATTDSLHAEIQDKYGDYIIEGNYNNNEQPYVGLLFNEGMDASDKYSVPEITYTLDVVDATGLMEYRQPIVTKYSCNLCHYTSQFSMGKCPECGHEGIEVYEDTYNDLVHKLHSVGQIVPKAGDYVTVYDEPMGMYGVPALITEIQRRIDDPMSNKIKLDTSYTDDEELVGNIITATNTVLSNADIYARTAVLKADGTIDSESISKTMDDPNANITIVGTSGNMLLTGSSLKFTDPVTPTHAMKYSGTGIFTTVNYEAGEEGTEWIKLMTPTGINANYINAGAIDTKKINIMSGLTSKILLDEYGLAIKHKANNATQIASFDKEKAKTLVDYAKTWGEQNNLSTFVGVDKNKNALMYTKGFVVAEEGSNIANWVTSDRGFYHLYEKTDGTTDTDLWLSPTGQNPLGDEDGKATVNGITDNFAIFANNNFGVTTAGILHAQDAVVSGTITSNNATITGGSLKVGNNFSVDTQGNLTAKNINAYDGKIGQFQLTQSKLYSGSGNTQAGMGVYGSEYAFWAGSETSSSAPFHVGHDGAVSCSNLTVTGGSIKLGSNFKVSTSGYITASGATLSSSTISGTLKTGDDSAGWIITADVIKNRGDDGEGGRANLKANGTLALYPNVGGGGSHLFNDGARISATAGVAISSNSNGAVTAPDKNIDIKACNNATVYIASMSGTNGTGETSAIYCSLNKVEIKGNDEVKLASGNNSILVQDDEIAIHPATNDGGLQIYGSYDNNTTYHTGRSGQFEVAYDSALGIKTAYLCFVNGIFVGMKT